jgi:small-conductance mechanosensitive channel
VEILQASFYGNTTLNWGIALGASTAIAVAAMVGKPLLIRHFEERAKRTRTQVDDALVHALKATQVWLIAALALSIGSHGLILPAEGAQALGSVATVALFVQVGLWLNALLGFWLTSSRSRAMATNASAATSLSALGLLGQLLLWTLILLLVLDNLGVDVTTLIAGLGIGGIAVALAVQNILGDLFASLSIVIDKPFVIGDFIIVDNYMGTVEHVGLKTTRIRSLDGEQIIFSNGDLLKTRMRNYKRMYERRVVFPFRVAYETPPEQLELIPDIVRKLIEGHKNTRFERSHFYRFGESSLDFETVFWVLTPDYNVYMDIQQALNLQLMRELLKLGIAFALPTQALQTARPVRARLPHAREEGAAGTELPKRRLIHQ